MTAVGLAKEPFARGDDIHVCGADGVFCFDHLPQWGSMKNIHNEDIIIWPVAVRNPFHLEHLPFISRLRLRRVAALFPDCASLRLGYEPRASGRPLRVGWILLNLPSWAVSSAGEALALHAGC